MGRIPRGDAALSFSSWKQRLWHALHTRAAHPDAPFADEAAWLHRFAKSIPCRRCRGHWKALCRQHPPELASRDLYFRWTVRMHNAINDRVGHPRFPWAEACQRWEF